MSSHICPNCGCNLGRFDQFEFGNIRLDEYGTILFEGREMQLPKSQHLIVEALIRAQGRGLTKAVLADILNSDIYDASVAKYIERVRSSFREVTDDFQQIIALRGFGAYRWLYQKPANSR